VDPAFTFNMDPVFPFVVDPAYTFVADPTFTFNAGPTFAFDADPASTSMSPHVITSTLCYTSSGITVPGRQKASTRITATSSTLFN